MKVNKYQSGFLDIIAAIVVAILLVGMTTTVYLVRHNQDLRKYAMMDEDGGGGSDLIDSSSDEGSADSSKERYEDLKDDQFEEAAEKYEEPRPQPTEVQSGGGSADSGSSSGGGLSSITPQPTAVSQPAADPLDDCLSTGNNPSDCYLKYGPTSVSEPTTTPYIWRTPTNSPGYQADQAPQPTGSAALPPEYYWAAALSGIGNGGMGGDPCLMYAFQGDMGNYSDCRDAANKTGAVGTALGVAAITSPIWGPAAADYAAYELPYAVGPKLVQVGYTVGPSLAKWGARTFTTGLVTEVVGSTYENISSEPNDKQIGRNVSNIGDDLANLGINMVFTGLNIYQNASFIDYSMGKRNVNSIVSPRNNQQTQFTEPPYNPETILQNPEVVIPVNGTSVERAAAYWYNNPVTPPSGFPAVDIQKIGGIYGPPIVNNFGTCVWCTGVPPTNKTLVTLIDVSRDPIAASVFAQIQVSSFKYPITGVTPANLVTWQGRVVGSQMIFTPEALKLVDPLH